MDKQDLIHQELVTPEARIDVFLFQETFLTDDKLRRHKLIGYHLYHRQRDDNGTQSRGGATVGVRDDRRWLHKEVHRSPEGCPIESITVCVTSMDATTAVYFTSAYCRPGIDITEAHLRMAFPSDEVPPNSKWIVGTDANAHHTLWDSFKEEDTRGNTLAEFMAAEDLVCENDPFQATRTKTTAKGLRVKTTKTSPDVTMSRNATTTNWKTENNVQSDHNWIKFTVDNVESLSPTKRKFWCLKKAKWDLFKTVADTLITGLLKKNLDTISAAMLHAMKQACPKGSREEAMPVWTDEMDKAHKAVEAADKESHDNPSKESLEKAQTLRQVMKETFREEKKKVFWEKFTTLKANNEVWGLLKNSKRSPQASTNTILTSDDGTELKTDRQKAEAFVKRYAKVSRRTGPVPKKYSVNGANCRPLTWDEFCVALTKMSKGKAVGPDELPIEAVINLSESCQKALLAAMNDSYLRGDVPLIWRRGCIIPILKPDKPATEVGSYRPVTLTSQISKLMERMIARRIIYEIQPKLHTAQYGFRSGLSTVDALMEVIDELVRAYDNYDAYRSDSNQTRYTFDRAIAVLIDFTSAFDTIGHHAVLEQLEKLGCGQYEMRWVRSFLSGRQGRAQVGDKQSEWVDFDSGVPQGTVLGPLLFIVAMNDLLVDLGKQSLKTVVFADDLTLIVKGCQLDKCIRTAQTAMDTIDRWTTKSCMSVNIKKTFGIIFSHSHNAKASVFDKCTATLMYKGSEIHIYKPTDLPEHALTIAKSRLLGVHFDRFLTFQRQVPKIKEGLCKARQCVGFLSGQTIGATRKMLCEFHEIYARSRELYAVETYWHLLSDSNRDLIGRMDREGLRKATGLMNGARACRLTAESGVTPLDIQVKMKQAIYYERTIRQQGSQTTRAERPPPLISKQNHESKAQYRETPMNECKLAAEKVIEWAGGDPRKIKRALLIRVSTIPPWARTDEVNVKFITEVAPGAKKSKLTVEEQRDLVLGVVNELLKKATIQGWTDGSSHVKLRMSGSAGLLKRKVNDAWVAAGTSKAAAGKYSCSFTSEGTGLKELLILLEDEEGQDIVLFVDCQSLLIALAARSIDQIDAELEEIWRLLLKVGSKNSVTIQHIFSHCGIAESDEVDTMANEAAKSLLQCDIPISFRDARALIKAWGKSMTKASMAGMKTEKGFKRTKEELLWTREEQVIAAQLRDADTRHFDKGPVIDKGGNVRIIGEWPRQLDKEMAASCRFCTPLDHAPKNKEKEANPASRSSKDHVTCSTCKHEYTTRFKFNEHLNGKTKTKCKAEQKPIPLLKAQKAEPVQQKDIVRRPCRGPPETLAHVLDVCKVANEKWGKHNGTLKSKVDKLVQIKKHLDALRESESIKKPSHPAPPAVGASAS